MERKKAKAKRNNMKKKLVTGRLKKTDEWLPVDVDMNDTCWCCCDCITPCGRNHRRCKSKWPVTCSDLSSICKSYVPYKETYKVIVEIPRIDPTCPHQRNNGYFIEREVELTEDDLSVLLDAIWEQRHVMDTSALRKKFQYIIKTKIDKERKRIDKMLEEYNESKHKHK